MQRKLTAMQRTRDQGLPVARDERQTVGRFLADWLDMVRPTVKPKTYRGYEQHVRIHLVPGLGKVPLTKLAPQHVRALWSRKLEEQSAPRTVCHIHAIHAVLHKAMEDTQRLGLVQRNVTELVDPPHAERHEMQALTPEQARTLLAEAEGYRLEALFVVALTTGMWQGELLALRWRDVDLDDRYLQVRYTLQKVPGQQFAFAEPKTPHSRRKIDLTALAVEALRTHRARQREERLALGPEWTDLDLVFPNRLAKPLDGTNVLHYHLYPLLKRAGLPRIRFHDLRHTAATLLLPKNVPAKVVSALLGHASVAITLNLYSHVLPDMQQQAAAAMDAALSVN